MPAGWSDAPARTCRQARGAGGQQVRPWTRPPLRPREQTSGPNPGPGRSSGGLAGRPSNRSGTRITAWRSARCRKSEQSWNDNRTVNWLVKLQRRDEDKFGVRNLRGEVSGWKRIIYVSSSNINWRQKSFKIFYVLWESYVVKSALKIATLCVLLHLLWWSFSSYGLQLESKPIVLSLVHTFMLTQNVLLFLRILITKDDEQTVDHWYS